MEAFVCGHGLHPYHGAGDDPQAALRTQDQLAQVGAGCTGGQAGRRNA